jgi:hypothetical protein
MRFAMKTPCTAVQKCVFNSGSISLTMFQLLVMQNQTMELFLNKQIEKTWEGFWPGGMD